MSDREKFLSEFSPIPEGAALPERILWEYEAQSCLAEPRDGRLVLRLRRKSDGVLAVLKAAPAGRELPTKGNLRPFKRDFPPIRRPGAFHRKVFFSVSVSPVLTWFIRRI